MMERIRELPELLPCRVCHEDCAYLEHENGWCCYITCGNCGSSTAFCAYNSEEEMAEAEKNAVRLWNFGKVIAEARLE